MTQRPDFRLGQKEPKAALIGKAKCKMQASKRIFKDTEQKSRSRKPDNTEMFDALDSAQIKVQRLAQLSSAGFFSTIKS